VLKIAVHDGDKWRRGRQHALDARGTEAAPTDPANAPDSAIMGGKHPYALRGPIRGIVVDKNHLPIDSVQNSLEPLCEHRDVVAFVKGRHDDAQFRCTDQQLVAGINRLGFFDHHHVISSRDGLRRSGSL